ncbi:MAG: hypothetical protein GAK45_02090 [Pseudomonas citronellolis]|nr:MAG: hypothetical protein GAK45_02090 [Pseudomonas citronellolis]
MALCLVAKDLQQLRIEPVTVAGRRGVVDRQGVQVAAELLDIGQPGYLTHRKVGEQVRQVHKGLLQRHGALAAEHDASFQHTVEQMLGAPGQLGHGACVHHPPAALERMQGTAQFD